MTNTASNYFDLSANLASVAALYAGLSRWPVVDTGFGLGMGLLAVPLIYLLGFPPRQRIILVVAVATSMYLLVASEQFGTALAFPPNSAARIRNCGEFGCSD